MPPHYRTPVENAANTSYPLTPCRMRLLMRSLFNRIAILLRCTPALFRGRNKQAIVEIAFRQQLATDVAVYFCDPRSPW